MSTTRRPVSEAAYYWLHSQRATDEACRERLIGVRDNREIIGERLSFEIRRYDARIEVFDFLLSLVPEPNEASEQRNQERDGPA